MLHGPQHGRTDGTFFSDISGYKQVKTNIYSIQQNFLNSTNLRYYLPNEIDHSVLDQPNNLTRIPGGNINSPDLLYTNLGIDANDTLEDEYGILRYNHPFASKR